MNIFIEIIEQLGTTVAIGCGICVLFVVFSRLNVLITIVFDVANRVRRLCGLDPLPCDDFIRRCGMEPLPKHWPFKRPSE